MLDAYEAFRTDSGIPARWEIIYGAAFAAGLRSRRERCEFACRGAVRPETYVSAFSPAPTPGFARPGSRRLLAPDVPWAFFAA